MLSERVCISKILRDTAKLSSRKFVLILLSAAIFETVFHQPSPTMGTTVGDHLDLFAYASLIIGKVKGNGCLRIVNCSQHRVLHRFISSLPPFFRKKVCFAFQCGADYEGVKFHWELSECSVSM